MSNKDGRRTGCYEHVVIVRPDLSAIGASEVLSEILARLREDDASVLRHEYWGLRSLAYRVAGVNKAHYMMVRFVGTPRALSSVESLARYDERILRWSTVRAEPTTDRSPLAVDPELAMPQVRDGPHPSPADVRKVLDQVLFFPGSDTADCLADAVGLACGGPSREKFLTCVRHGEFNYAQAFVSAMASYLGLGAIVRVNGKPRGEDGYEVAGYFMMGVSIEEGAPPLWFRPRQTKHWKAKRFRPRLNVIANGGRLGGLDQCAIYGAAGEPLGYKIARTIIPLTALPIVHVDAILDKRIVVRETIHIITES